MSLFDNPVRGHDKYDGTPCLVLGTTSDDNWIVMDGEGTVGTRVLTEVRLDWRWDEDHPSGVPGWNDLIAMETRNRPGEPEDPEV